MKHRPYSERELAIILGNVPKTAQAKLKAMGVERSYQSIAQTQHRIRRGERGQKRKRTPFKADEDAWLRKNFETATPEEMAHRFPHRGLEAIYAHARNKLGLRKERRLWGRAAPTEPHLDIVRQIIARAMEDGISLAALDREVNGKSYFRTTWRTGSVNIGAIFRAVAFFGGRIDMKINWQDH